MLRIDGFQRQQQATALLMLRLCNLVELYRDGRDALRIAMQLHRLLGQVRLQCAIEERTLYQPLIASGHAETAALASELRDRMGGLAHDLEAFMQRWSSSALIDSGFAVFKAELMALLGALDRHAEQSARTLYPMFDSGPEAPLSNAA